MYDLRKGPNTDHFMQWLWENRRSLDRIKERVRSNYVPGQKLGMSGWLSQGFRCLALYGRNDEGMKMDFEDKFHKVEDTRNNWQNKRLTLPVKIEMIKTLAASQLQGLDYVLITYTFKIAKRKKWFAFQISLGRKRAQNQTVWNDCWLWRWW